MNCWNLWALRPCSMYWPARLFAMGCWAIMRRNFIQRANRSPGTSGPVPGARLGRGRDFYGQRLQRGTVSVLRGGRAGPRWQGQPGSGSGRERTSWFPPWFSISSAPMVSCGVLVDLPASGSDSWRFSRCFFQKLVLLTPHRNMRQRGRSRTVPFQDSHPISRRPFLARLNRGRRSRVTQ